MPCRLAHQATGGSLRSQRSRDSATITIAFGRRRCGAKCTKLCSETRLMFTLKSLAISYAIYAIYAIYSIYAISMI